MEVEQSFQWQTPEPPGFEEHKERKYLSWKQSIHKPSLLLFSCNTAIITEYK
jgi:hypothetical protein